MNFQGRDWRPALRLLGIRPRPFYNTRHTYISFLLAAGAKPLFVCRQTGTSLEMIEKHYGDHRVTADALDRMIEDQRETEASGARGRDSAVECQAKPGTYPEPHRSGTVDCPTPKLKNPLQRKGFLVERATGIEPATSSLGSLRRRRRPRRTKK